MDKKNEWNKVTWYTKLLAVLLFLGVLPVLTFYIGTQYQKTVNELKFINTVVKNQQSDNKKIEIPIFTLNDAESACTYVQLNKKQLTFSSYPIIDCNYLCEAGNQGTYWSISYSCPTDRFHQTYIIEVDKTSKSMKVTGATN